MSSRCSSPSPWPPRGCRTLACGFSLGRGASSPRVPRGAPHSLCAGGADPRLAAGTSVSHSRWGLGRLVGWGLHSSDLEEPWHGFLTLQRGRGGPAAKSFTVCVLGLPGTSGQSRGPNRPGPCPGSWVTGRREPDPKVARRSSRPMSREPGQRWGVVWTRWGSLRTEGSPGQPECWGRAQVRLAVDGQLSRVAGSLAPLQKVLERSEQGSRVT